jgi:antitoxin (DNA-binding transcriptional repressor) of toxin-antitoxin stability system
MVAVQTQMVEATNEDLKELIRLVQEGVEVILTENGVPLAHILPMNEEKKTRIMGLHAGAWEVSDDFDDPLPDEFWLGEE